MARRVLVSVCGGSKSLGFQVDLELVTAHAYVKIRAAVTCILPVYF